MVFLILRLIHQFFFNAGHELTDAASLDSWPVSLNSTWVVGVGAVPTAYINVSNPDAKGEIPGELVQGVQELLIPREGEDPGTTPSWDRVFIRELLGLYGPNFAL